jgi:hypothetical protein
MNVNTLTNYVNQDVDDDFRPEKIVLWFNRGIAQYNLIPPLTTYKSVLSTDRTSGNSATDGLYYLSDDYYSFSDSFMLGVMLPYLVSGVKLQEASLSERQVALQEFMQNARMWKASTNIAHADMLNQQNSDIGIFQLGENVYLSDMTRSPVSGIWQKQTVYAEVATAVDVTFYQNSDLDGKVTVRKPIGVQLSAFTTEGGITGTIYTDAGKTTSVPLTTIITENKVFYYGA